jgi:hypothetical protein
MPNHLSRLHLFITTYYDVEELRTLCLDLGVDYDSLRGEGKAHKARELVLYLGRQRQLDRLLDALSRGRPASFDLGTGPAALEALYAALPAFETHATPPRQYTSSPSAPKAPPAYAPPPLPAPETLPDPGPLPPGSRLPFGRNALFTGRVALLLDLARTLLHDEGAETMPVARSIQGMGGVGKTQLAVEFAYRYGRFFDGVHWLNAARPEDLGDEVARCGAEMNLPHWPHERPEQVARTLREWRQGGRRLVVLDNLEKVNAAREWLGRLSGGMVRVLLTARRGAWPRDLGLKPLWLDVFSPRESLSTGVRGPRTGDGRRAGRAGEAVGALATGAGIGGSLPGAAAADGGGLRGEVGGRVGTPFDERLEARYGQSHRA